jgi:hypothetical protein
VKKEEHHIYIRPDGTIQTIYDDSIRPLIDQAEHATITRVSEVNADTDNFWRADLTRSHGPVSPPFALRADALAWEVDWVNAQLTTNTLEV